MSKLKIMREGNLTYPRPAALVAFEQNAVGVTKLGYELIHFPNRYLAKYLWSLRYDGPIPSYIQCVNGVKRNV